jgi:hypothetical protein
MDLLLLLLLTVINVATIAINVKILTENYKHHLLRAGKP